jgi:ATP-dependent Clp endopeptidase proteolytic subunit ClpP
MNNKQSWYSINAKDTEQYADVYLYDEVGNYGVSAKDFVNDLKLLKGRDIYLHINCVGGEVFDGMAIYNTLKKYKGKVTAYIEGIAASMGSIIPLAADEIIMSENSLYMIHNAWGGAMGEADDMRKTATLLDKLSSEIANIYTKKTGLPLSQIEDMMDEETWFNSEEALEYGFIDRISDAVMVAAKYDISKFKNKTQKEIVNQLNNNKKSKTMTEELKSWFGKKVEEIIAAVKGDVKSTEVPEVNVILADNEEISNKLSELESKVVEVNTLSEAKDNEITELKAEVERLTSKSHAKGTEIKTESDPAVVKEEVLDSNVVFFNTIANSLKEPFVR